MTPLELYQSLQNEDYYLELVRCSLVMRRDPDRSGSIIHSPFQTFLWVRSPQGFDYWAQLYKAWFCICSSSCSLKVSEYLDTLESLYPKSEYPEFYL